MPSNSEFLRAIFGDEAGRAHVTGFPYDPAAIPKDRHLAAWAGKPGGDLDPEHNNYYAISLFTGARRRKAEFEATYIVVLDDVGEKLARPDMLPPPTYVLETSPGSEQWGYLLADPCTDRARVENLQDGLVAGGLCPDGKDPGMKGVTRYVRLPDGRNTKASKMLFGLPYRHFLKVWEPGRTTTMEELAAPFGIDLDAPRREQRVDGAADLPDHPVLGHVLVKEARGPGRFDISCPWAGEHTGGADDGAAVFTNEDGSLGFRCHHGVCEDRNAGDLLAFIEQETPGFQAKYKLWQVDRALGEVAAPDPIGDRLAVAMPGSPEQRRLAEELLKLAEDSAVLEREETHAQVRDVMGWTKQDFTRVIKALRRDWYEGGSRKFDDDLVYVKQLDAFYDFSNGATYSVQGFTNSYLHVDENIRMRALKDGLVEKVDRLDYAPGEPRVFREGKELVANMYSEDGDLGAEGDATPWLNHFDAMGWGSHKKHLLQWMAYTLCRPERKINHMLILGSPQGAGKDFLLFPLVQAMGCHAKVVNGDALAEQYSGYLLRTKYLHINEADLGGHRDAAQIVNKLKPLAAAPPDRIPVREMYTKPFSVRNIVNATFCTNSRMPLRVHDSRRFYAVWSDLYVRQADGNALPEWADYWSEAWPWMRDGGAKACIWYLRHCVDLSDFDPGAAPPVTEFMQDIQRLSKSGIRLMLEDAVRSGVFRSDLMTTEDVIATLRSEAMFGGNSADTKHLSVRQIELNLRDMGTPCLSAEHVGRVWAIDNAPLYASLPKKELGDIYLGNQPPREKPGLQLVGPRFRGN